jgi:hypothetical protein
MCPTWAAAVAIPCAIAMEHLLHATARLRFSRYSNFLSDLLPSHPAEDRKYQKNLFCMKNFADKFTFHRPSN